MKFVLEKDLLKLSPLKTEFPECHCPERIPEVASLVIFQNL